MGDCTVCNRKSELDSSQYQSGLPQGELCYTLKKVACKALILAREFKSSNYIEMLREIAPEIDNSKSGELNLRELPDLRSLIVITEEPVKGSPCADTATPLMALGARALITGPDSNREVAVEELITGPGTNSLGEFEIVHSVVVPPLRENQWSLFLKHSRRSMVDIAAVSVCISLIKREGVIAEVDIFLGIDAIELRLKNAMVEGDKIPGVATIGSCGFIECLERVRKLSDWDERQRNKKPGEGLGIACYSFISGGVFNWFNTQYPFSAAEVRVFDDGTAQLSTLAADIGQGSDLILVQILAEELGQEMSDIRLVKGDTAVCPQSDLGTWGSRVTLMAGNAVRAAAQQVKEQLFNMVSLKFDLNVIHEIECGNGHIYAKSKPTRRIPFGEVVAMVQRANRGEPLKATGYYTPRDCGLVSPAFSFGAQIADTAVDLETGMVRVNKMFTVHDCGTELNPMAVEGQLEGSIQMSLGYALSEELIMQEGQTLNTTFLDYKVPVAEDMPPSVSETVETYEASGPFGAKEAGEGLACPTAPAIADAVRKATGYCCMDLPITPDKIRRQRSCSFDGVKPIFR